MTEKTEQGTLFEVAPTPEPVREAFVWCECPGCGDVWLQAIVTPGAWWGAVKPLSCLSVPYCPSCGHAPPMLDAQRVDRSDGKA